MARNDSDGGLLGLVGRLLTDNPVAALLLAVLMGTTGGSLVGRPDPWTGSDAREQEERLEQKINRLETRQALDDQHRIEAVQGYQRIRSMEQTIAKQAQAIEGMREEQRRNTEDIKELLRRVLSGHE